MDPISHITQSIYYYKNDETGELIVDEEGIMAEFKEQLAHVIMNNIIGGGDDQN